MACEQEIERAIAAEGQTLLGWRDVPIDNRGLSRAAPSRSSRSSARSSSAAVRATSDTDAFERKLYVIRKQYGPCHPGAGSCLTARSSTCRRARRAPSSTRACCWPTRSATYYLDLHDERMVSALALVHQRFSTNTFPDLGSGASVPLHLPQRRNQHAARQRQLDPRPRRRHSSLDVLGEDLDKLWPLIYDGQSDSASFDNALELLVMGGYPLRACDDDDDPRGLGRTTRRWTRIAAPSTNTTPR